MNSADRSRRWRLLLGAAAEESIGQKLIGDDIEMDRCLESLYSSDDGTTSRSASLSASAPKVARWLGDIRKYFSSSVVRVMQKDALDRLGLQRMLLEPEMLMAVEPDIHLVSTLISLKSVIPAKTKDTARQVVAQLVDSLIQQIEEPTRSAITGSLNRAERNPRPRHNEIDWQRTILANLKHYQEEYKSVIPEKLIGYGRKRSSLRDIVLLVDQSGSMASSVVYSSIFAAVMASIPSVDVKMVVFDTEVVDLTDMLRGDPVDVLFGVQLGGGTDIDRALGYVQQQIDRPDDTILVLISDLYEGGSQDGLLQKAAHLKAAGVNFITLLALADDGAPCFDHNIAAKFSAMEIPCFACTPDKFPDLMAAAIKKQDISLWAASEEIVTTREQN